MGAVTPMWKAGESAGAAYEELPGKLGLEWPLVSVVITCYNYSRYIEACLASVQQQTYERFECIVVDDASTDGSPEIVEAYLRSHDLAARFRLLRRSENGGQLAAFRSGLENCSGRFVVFLDADDLLLENFLSVHVKTHLSEFPVAFTSSNQVQINENGELIAGVHPDLQVDREPFRAVTQTLISPTWIWATTSSMMFRRAALEAVMPAASEADEHFRRCADNYVCHFANLLASSILMPEVLGCYRRHGANNFSQNPFIGGRAPTGNMRNHPRHMLVLKTIRSRILAETPRFSSLLSEKGVPRLLARTMTPAMAAAMLLRALITPKPPLSVGLSFRLLTMSTRNYVVFWTRAFTRQPPLTHFEFQPAGCIPR